jgi:hypothetical protein
MGKPAYVTTAAAGQRLDRTPRTIRNWVKTGRLDGEKIGDRVLVEAASVAALERPGAERKP